LTLAGTLLSHVIRAWIKTWRVELLTDPESHGAPRVYAFWHGQQMGLLAARRTRATHLMVSWSRDGAIQTGVMRGLRFGVVRGSSSRGGGSALRSLVRRLRAAQDAAFAVDGPHGPLHRAQGGAATAAGLAGALLVPAASAARPALVLKNTWDQFEIPLPFARVCVALGPALSATDAREDPGLLARAIERTRERAVKQLGGPAS
jgi:lysophospholipid acyltransferase (LPLAT)-like uncharacterized protein